MIMETSIECQWFSVPPWSPESLQGHPHCPYAAGHKPSLAAVGTERWGLPDPTSSWEVCSSWNLPSFIGKLSNSNRDWLVVTGTWLLYLFMFSIYYIGIVIIPIDEVWRNHIFQRGRYTTNQEIFWVAKAPTSGGFNPGRWGKNNIF